MRSAKTVTPKKIDANRRNAKLSTGPRTDRGKRNARFNALTLGLFAKHVVIPVCDEVGEKKFQQLLDSLHQDFQPVGSFEEWLVVRIAECMWRLRRASRCESGSVQDSIERQYERRDGKRSIELLMEIWLLERAEKELRESGTLLQRTYERVAPIVEEERRNRIQSEIDAKVTEAKIDSELFLACIADRKELVESKHLVLTSLEDRRDEVRCNRDSLPPEDYMDRILRYEDRMHKQIDWALQRLLESRERRLTVQP